MTRYRAYRFLPGAVLLATVLFAASARAAQIQWDVRSVQSAGVPITTTADARDLLSGFIAGSSDVTAGFDVLNFRISSPSGGKFSHNTLFPGVSPGHEHDFVIDAHGNISIPAAGAYTFGVSSDDGFALQVGNFSSEFPKLRKAGETYSTFNFDHPGIYAVDLLFFQHQIAAELELFASPGTYTAFGQPGSNFQLVGDVANGGLSLSNPGVGASVPEPSAVALIVLPASILLSQRRRSRSVCITTLHQAEGDLCGVY